MSSLKESVLQQRYLQPGETELDMFRRVAKHVAETDGEAEAFYQLMAAHDFLPNTPALCNAGVPSSSGQLFACFVLGIKDSMFSIFTTLRDMAIIQKTGGGTGFCFSNLRPSNDMVSSTMGVASGPISFMHAYDAATETVKQGGVRRGANMGCMHVWHPDIEAFITCKDDLSVLHNFNISVLITDDFMEAVREGNPYNLRFGGRVYKTVDAKELWKKICYQAWKNGEPGIIFIDEVNRKHPLIHPISATNPCGEQPLLEDEACDLGSINLGNMVYIDSYGRAKFDFEHFAYAVYWGIRFLDNCIDVNVYPLPQIEKTVKHNRKVGLGIMGYADMLVKMGLKYGSQEAKEFTRLVARVYEEEAISATVSLAKSKGPCQAYLDGETKWSFPVRNTTVTTIAPTGTISIIAECSGGIEPIFSPYYLANRLDTQFAEYHPLFKQKLEEAGLLKEFEAELMGKGHVDLKHFCTELDEIFVPAHRVTSKQHVEVQAIWQEHVQNAISKTVNLPNSASLQDVMDAYEYAFILRCKGVTVYRDGSRGGVLLTTETKQEDAPPTEIIDPVDGSFHWTCPECGSENIGYKEGCNFCPDCGFTKCG